jgi:hypothetical protein
LNKNKKNHLSRYFSNRNKAKAINVVSTSSSNEETKRFSTKNLIIGKNVNITFECDWDCVFFEDGYINFKYQHNYFTRRNNESRKYLNYIKGIYHFRSVPKLIITVEDGVVLKIDNEASLFFYINFFKATHCKFTDSDDFPFSFSVLRKYTNGFYKKNMPYVFTTDALRYLCELSYSNLPIIPVGETVVNKRGHKEIQMSFLFPLKNDKGLFIVWESIYHSKASYIFSIKIYNSEELYPILLYITGARKNKRFTLINSIPLQKNLQYKKRLFHTDLESWKLELRNL